MKSLKKYLQEKVDDGKKYFLVNGEILEDKVFGESPDDYHAYEFMIRESAKIHSEYPYFFYLMRENGIRIENGKLNYGNHSETEIEELREVLKAYAKEIAELLNLTKNLSR